MEINKNNPPDTLFETLVSADRYILPFTDTQGGIIAIAELQELNGKWTVGTSMEIDADGLRNITDKIQKGKQSPQDNGSMYYIEFLTNNSVGLLAVSGNEEFFIHLDNYCPDEPQNVKICCPASSRNTQGMEIITLTEGWL
ncbi:MAG: hypothetical protein AAGU12_14710 [Clostridiales bacterium]